MIVPLRINKSTTGFYFAFALLCLEADLVRTRHLTLTRMMAAVVADAVRAVQSRAWKLIAAADDASQQRLEEGAYLSLSSSPP